MVTKCARAVEERYNARSGFCLGALVFANIIVGVTVTNLQSAVEELKSHKTVINCSNIQNCFDLLFSKYALTGIVRVMINISLAILSFCFAC